MRKQHDIILTDLGLPDSTGLETLKRLKETGTNIPIIILTGLDSKEVAIISLQEGAQEYLSKNNLDTDILSRTIKISIERKTAEEKQKFAIEILKILNIHNDIKGLIDDLLKNLKSFTGYDLIAIRIKEKNDYPYYAQEGFSEEFIINEKNICAHDNSGKIIYNEEGLPHIECLCGIMLRGEIDKTMHYATKNGSFCSNNLSEDIKDILLKTDNQKFRLRCIDEGFSSLALIPLYSENGIVGLLQFADYTPDRFTFNIIEYLEYVSKSIGVAIGRVLKNIQ